MNTIETLMRIADSDDARRELAWLRAKEKSDIGAARDLERIDPTLLDRLAAAGIDLSADQEDASSRERYGRLFDECYARHARTLGGGAL